MKYIIKNKYSVVTIFEMNTNVSASGINLVGTWKRLENQEIDLRLYILK